MARVLVTFNMSMVNITLAETLGYLVLYFIQLYLLALYALCVAHCDPLWSKSFKAALVEYVESGLDVIDPWEDHCNYFLPIH